MDIRWHQNCTGVTSAPGFIYGGCSVRVSYSMKSHQNNDKSWLGPSLSSRFGFFQSFSTHKVTRAENFSFSLKQIQIAPPLLASASYRLLSLSSLWRRSARFSIFSRSSRNWRSVSLSLCFPSGCAPAGTVAIRLVVTNCHRHLPQCVAVSFQPLRWLSFRRAVQRFEHCMGHCISPWHSCRGHQFQHWLSQQPKDHGLLPWARERF